MEKRLSEIKMENKYNRTISKEDLDIGMEYMIKTLKFVPTKSGKKIVIILISKVKWLIYLHVSVSILK